MALARQSQIEAAVGSDSHERENWLKSAARVNIPKSWPKRFIYARESVSTEVNLSFLRHFLQTGNPDDLHKHSWVIEKKCVHPHLQITKITSSLQTKNQQPHPLTHQKTCKDHQNYGIFATKKINAGIELGEYVGEISISSFEKCMQLFLQKNFYSEYLWILKQNNLIFEINAQNIANELALVNDCRGLGPAPNVKMTSIIHKGVFYFGYVTICEIQKGEEILIDYGEIFQKRLLQNSGIRS